MMFSSNPLDKSCIGPDCSPGRSNASSRFPVVIPSLGDENQQIRIQLAVHKYNNSGNTLPSSRCGMISPFRNSFLNNSVKVKNYEGDTEGTSKNESRIANQYEGVGAFPTIHLKKRPVRYRPIRRFNDVKVSCPELPVNRFLGNLPDSCSDLKSSTRSVLDVLEDLSGKKIHSKDENESNKPKSRGLGGDYLLNPNASYKPLFVQKPKINPVLTRDNTTQTLSSVTTDTQSPQSSSKFIRNDTSDPRAELRRKLAKQNNEIFASLSSSVSLSFGVKRKIDNVLQAGDESPSEGSAMKNAKIDNQANNFKRNGISKSAIKYKRSSKDPVKGSRKSLLNEPSTPTSPNKDRLTTIFLDMQDTSPRAQMFPKNPAPPEPKTTDAASQPTTTIPNGFITATTTSAITNGFPINTPTSLVNGSADSGSTANGNDKSEINSPCLNFAAKTNSTDLKKPEMKQFNKLEFSFPVQPPKEVTNSASATFKFGINANFSFPKAFENSSDFKDTSSKTGNESNQEKKDEVSKPSTLGSSMDKPDFGSFKFGADANSPLKEVKSLTTEAVTVSATTTPITTPQFSFGSTSNTITPTTQPFPVQLQTSSSQDTVTTPTKSLFALGTNNPQTKQQQSPEATLNTEKMTPNGLTTSIPTSIQSCTFGFGQKPTVNSPSKTTVATSQPSVVSFSPSGNNSSSTVTPSKSLFSFGQKTETVGTTATAATTNEPPKFSFAFGQKSDTNPNAPSGDFGVKNQNLFSFGQKPFPEGTQNTTTTTATSTTSSTMPPLTQPTPIFGQNVSAPGKQDQVPGSQVASTFGSKSEPVSIGGTSTPVFGQAFPAKTSIFEAPVVRFGTSTTQSSTVFKTSTSSAPSFSFGASATSQPSSTFGASTASQTTPAFGATSTAQSGFGGSTTTQSTPAFGTSVTTPMFGTSSSTLTSTFPTSTVQSNFKAPSTSIPAFASAALSQGTPSFTMSPTTQVTSSFGTSVPQSTPSFGSSSTTQSTPSFGSGFGASTASQPNTVFGAPIQSSLTFGASAPQSSTSFATSTDFSSVSSTQSNTTFGVPVSTSTFGAPSSTSTPGFGASQPSFSQPFDNKPAASLGQSTSIFGQNPTPSFSSAPAFNSNQNVFEQKPAMEGSMFDQNKIQQGFGSTSQTFASPNKFSFGMSTSSGTGFPPNTTSAPVFSFGGSTAATPNTFTFGSSAPAAANNTQTPFAFKFGATTGTGKEGPGFGGNTSTFAFGGQMNNNPAPEQKPAFGFGAPQASSSAPFAFGTTPSPAVFSFGGSTAGSSASSGSSFNFGTPTPGGPFGQPPSASPAAPFPVPGTFSIGSGSSQSRPRVTSRPRRRP